mmetsp:Transcript_20164/g.38906  ORF Transcript_20164/g.38906 Transcript_20164/m.38906 type:complete len:248 (+) Transcript_20164:282-1025(+)
MRKGAPMGCALLHCRRSFHLQCALLKGCGINERFLKNGQWEFYCKEHLDEGDATAEPLRDLVEGRLKGVDVSPDAFEASSGPPVARQGMKIEDLTETRSPKKDSSEDLKGVHVQICFGQHEGKVGVIIRRSNKNNGRWIVRFENGKKYTFQPRSFKRIVSEPSTAKCVDLLKDILLQLPMEKREKCRGLLNELGMDAKLENAHFLEEEDLVPTLKKLEARRLLRTLKDAAPKLQDEVTAHASRAWLT